MTSQIAVEEATAGHPVQGPYPVLKTLRVVTPLETVRRTHSYRSDYVVVGKAWATRFGITTKIKGRYRISRLELLRRLAESEARTVGVPDKIIELPTGKVGTLRIDVPSVDVGELQPGLTG
jgi:hypothetical protein